MPPIMRQNERAARAAAAPSTDPGHDGGGRVVGPGTRWKLGTGTRPVPKGSFRRRGRRMPASRPFLVTRGRAAARRTWSPRPSSRAAARCACLRRGHRRARCGPRTASTTLLPATSRMTSPVLKPRSAAGPSASTSVTTTPLPSLPATLRPGDRVGRGAARPHRAYRCRCRRRAPPSGPSDSRTA